MENHGSIESAIDSWPYLASNCFVFHQPQVAILHRYNVAGIPYMKDVNEFKAAFEQLAAHNDDIDIFMIHQGIDEFDTTGLLQTGLTAKWLESKTDALVICGHYHSPKQIGTVINAGALVQHRASDAGDDRGCWVIDPDNKAKNTVVFYPIDGPKFVSVDNSGYSGSLLDAFVTIKAKSLKEAEKIKKQCEKAGAKSVAVQIEREFTTAHEQAVKLSTPAAMLDEYLGIVPKYGKHKADIMDLFNRVCLQGGQS